jgi:hypothetical protein
MRGGAAQCLLADAKERQRRVAREPQVLIRVETDLYIVALLDFDAVRLQRRSQADMSERDGMQVRRSRRGA